MSYGIPYMGSKQAIIQSLAMNFPKAHNFYDLFGGGFSVTHYMMEHKNKNYVNFHYNEINKDITELVQKAISGFYNYKNYTPEWISREIFFERLEDPYIRYIWSFGNNGKGYIFGKDIEEYKRSMHMAIVFDKFNDIAFDVFGFRKWSKEVNTILKRRIYLRQRVSYLNTKRKNPLKRGDLEQLQQLEQLERLEQLSNLSITSKDYREVEILKDSVVYCDIPYQGTVEYRNSFSHKDFFEWAYSRDFPVFISEYEIKDKRFKLIYEIDKQCLLQSNGNNNIKTERLYWNGK